MCNSKPKEYRFARCVKPAAQKQGEHEDDFEERKLNYIDKKECYSCHIPIKEAPGIIQSSGFAMEEATAKSDFKYTKLKDAKCYVADFYKSEGYMTAMAPLQFKTNSKAKNNAISHFILCIGRPIIVKYKIKEGPQVSNLEVKLLSGDALIVN
jgi:hypothetical protein